MKTYTEKYIVTVEAEAKNASFAATMLNGIAKGFVRSTAVAHLSALGRGTAKVVSTQKANPVTEKQLADEDIRIVSIIDVENMRNTAGFELGTPALNELAEWVYANRVSLVGPRSEPDFILSDFDPLLVQFDKTIAIFPVEAQELHTLNLGLALKDLGDSKFAFFVGVQTPIRMYRPDGKYDANWNFTRSQFGHGETYAEAVKNVYQNIKLMRKAKLV